MNDKLKLSKRVTVYEEFVDDCTDVSENGKVVIYSVFSKVTLCCLSDSWQVGCL